MKEYLSSTKLQIYSVVSIIIGMILSGAILGWVYSHFPLLFQEQYVWHNVYYFTFESFFVCLIVYKIIKDIDSYFSKKGK